MATLKNKIWKNVSKSQLKIKYNKEFSKYDIINKNNPIKRGRKKDVSYGKYEEYMKNEISIHVKNHILTKTEEYTFVNKKLHIISAEAYAFSDETIANKMKQHNITTYINSFTEEFFCKN